MYCFETKCVARSKWFVKVLTRIRSTRAEGHLVIPETEITSCQSFTWLPFPLSSPDADEVRTRFNARLDDDHGGRLDGVDEGRRAPDDGLHDAGFLQCKQPALEPVRT